MTPPLVTIVTPSLDQGPYIEETIRSVLDQDHPRIEYIVVDGGSRDGTVDVIRKFEDRLAWWVSEPDGGQASAINKGFARARGDIVGWLNSDDVLMPGAIRSAVATLEAHPDSDLAYAHSAYVDEAGRPLVTVRAWEFVPRRLLTGIPLVIQPSSLFRRRALEQVGPLDESLRFIFDHDLYVRMCRAGMRFERVDEVWSRFRIHPGSKTSNHWVGFNRELQTVVERTFAPGAGLPRRWEKEARANAWQWLGEAYLAAGDASQARSALLRALGACPFRSKSLMAAALLTDSIAGTRLGAWLRRLRYRLPDAPPGGDPALDGLLRS